MTVSVTTKQAEKKNASQLDLHRKQGGWPDSMLKQVSNNTLH